MTTIEEVNDSIDNISDALSVGWIIFCGAMVFLSQLGSFSLEASCVSETWIHSIVLKNIEDSFVGITLFSIFGYAIANSTTSFYGIIGFSYQNILL